MPDTGQVRPTTKPPTDASPTAIARQFDARPDEHFTYLLAKVEHLLERRLDQALASVELTLRQFSALVHIARTPGLSSADLARALLTSPQAVNTLVSRLRAAGLVERADGPARQPLALTVSTAGLDALRRAAPIATAAEADAIKGVDPADLATTQSVLGWLLEFHAGLSEEPTGGRSESSPSVKPCPASS